ILLVHQVRPFACSTKGNGNYPILLEWPDELKESIPRRRGSQMVFRKEIFVVKKYHWLRTAVGHAIHLAIEGHCCHNRREVAIFPAGVGIESPGHIIDIPCINIGLEDTATPAEEDIWWVFGSHSHLQLLFILVVLEKLYDRPYVRMPRIEGCCRIFNDRLIVACADIPARDSGGPIGPT